MAQAQHELGFVKEMDDRRIAAMLTNDVDQVAPWLDEDLIYIHSSGVKDDRDAYLKLIRDGSLVYHSCNPTFDRIISLGETAFLVTGRMQMDIDWFGRRVALENLFIAAWKQGGDGEWRLVSWQSTPLPKQDGPAH